MSVFGKSTFLGKVVVITGGHSGIGFGIATDFVLHGARVAMLGRRQTQLNEAADKLLALRKETKGDASWPDDCAIGIVCDVRSYEKTEQAMTSVFAKWGRLDILINSAAGNFLCSLEDLSPNAFKTVVEIDLLGTFHASKAAYPYLLQSAHLPSSSSSSSPSSSSSSASSPISPASSIINISATFHYSAAKYQGHPAAAKAGVDALTRTMAAEWGPAIRVNGVAPGPVAQTEGMARLGGGLDDLIGETLPAKRLGTAADVASSCLFLASSAASWITGHTLVVDGGSWVSSVQTVPADIYEEIRQQRKKKQPAKL